MDKEPGKSADAHRVDRSAYLADSDTMFASKATTVSNTNLNANNITGGVGMLVNNSQIINNVITGSIPKESDAIQIQISNFLVSRYVSRAVYGVQIEKGCTEGTRVQILRDIKAWIKDLKGPQIFWLAGMAGNGKSAIAWTVCLLANDSLDIVLGGSFFCSRSTGLSAQRDVRCVVPTLAQLMARQSAMFAEALSAELARDPEVLHQQVELQVNTLLYKPLLALKDSPVPILFVIDALDECGGQLNSNGTLNDTETHRIVSDMLEALVKFSSSPIKLPVKFLVTSRPETHIRDTHVSDVAFSKVLRLHTVDKQQVTADIRLYISSRLWATPALRAVFTEKDIISLVGLSDGLFIVAATALEHAFGAGIEFAETRFKSLLDASRSRLSIRATVPLDRMYAVIIEDAAKVGDIETDKLKALRRILAALLSARMTLSVAALAELLNLPVGQLRISLTRLHAVIHVPDDDDDAGLRPLHASFGDYLFGRASKRIRISESLGSMAMAIGCLQVLEKRLHFNVSQSRSSFEHNSDARPTGITLALEYACLQWIYHVSGLLESSSSGLSLSSTIRSRLQSWIGYTPHQSMLDERISEVIRPRLLFWLEIMSILKQVQRAAAMLMFAAATVQTKELSQFLRDANSFVASSQQAISTSAPHIYLSALPFADRDSLVYREFAPLCTGLISANLMDVSHHAGRLLMTLTGHDGAVNSIAYSSNGRMLASGSADGTVRIWDMRTGEELMTPLRSGDGAVWSVSLATNGESVVSGTDVGVVCVWSLVDAHAYAQRLRGHSAAVSSVLYSPKGSHLASTSTDSTVILWNSETHQQLALLRGHTGVVHALAFTPDSLTLATGSEDQTIRLWDAVTGKLRYKSSHLHEESIYSLCFLPDGQKIAAGSGNNIMLCKSQTGQNTALLHNGSSPILSVSPASDGLSLVSAYGKSVCLLTLPRFRVKTSSIILDGHTSTVRMATFSHNDLYIASVSDDCTIRIWSASNRSEVQPAGTQEATDNTAVSALIMSDFRTLTEHTDNVSSVAVSPDGAVILSGSDDCSVRVWDARSSTAMSSLLLRHTSLVSSIAVSSDGRLVASGSRDQKVRLWDLQTGRAVGDSMSPPSPPRPQPQPQRRSRARRLVMQLETLPRPACVVAVAFTPDARLFASVSEGKTVHIWDVATQQPSAIGPLSCKNWVSTVAVSPDGRLVTAGDSGGYISIWRSDTGQPVRDPLRTTLTYVCSIGFSPDGTCIVSGGTHSREHVRIWNISAGEQVLALTGHTDTVYSVTYSPDGRTIGTGSADMTVRLWDAVTGAPIALLAGHSGYVQSVAFTPDGHSIVSGSDDKTIRVWDFIGASPVSDADVAVSFQHARLNNGWLQTRSGKLLLWVPVEYHKFLYRLEGPRVIIQFDKNGLYQGESWISCWRGDASGPGLGAGSPSS